jgi:hypothetical protein
VTSQGVSDIERISTGRPSIRVEFEEDFPYQRMLDEDERVEEIKRPLPTDKAFKNILKSVRNEYKTRGIYSTNPTADVRQQMESEALRRYSGLLEQTTTAIPSRRRPPLIIEEDEDEAETPPPLEETETEGFGLHFGNFGKSKARIAKLRQAPRFIVGRGLALPQKHSNFVEFGKYAISIPQLQKGILTTRYANSGHAVTNFPPIKITSDFADFLEAFIDTEHLDDKRLNKLPSDEKRLFAKLINGSGLQGKYKVKVTKTKEEDDEEKRFHLVKGMFIAGNDNPEIVKELKRFIIKFMADGRIPRAQGQDLLLQLAL